MKNIKEPQRCMANAHRAAVYGGHSLQWHNLGLKDTAYSASYFQSYVWACTQ